MPWKRRLASFQSLFTDHVDLFSKNCAAYLPADHKTVTITTVTTTTYPEGGPQISLASATETEPMVWTANGTTGWFGENTVTHDGVDAAQSGHILDYGVTEAAITVNGPDTLSFWWKVSSEPVYDRLVFDIDGTFQFSISGEVDWQQKTVNIPAGAHTVRWSYLKDGSISAGADAGWIDEVSLVSQAFSKWADSFGLTGTDATPTADSDGDGINNLTDARVRFGNVRITAP